MPSEHQKDPERVAAGLKAAIHNPNVSEEGKASATERLNQMGGSADTGNESASTNRQLGGYKATLSNPRTSEEAKQHAREVLHGEDTSDTSGGGGEQLDSNVLRGYKATLHNPRVSEEAKEHAEQILRDNKAI